MEIYLENDLSHVKLVPQNKRYWFVRTFGGQAYESYISDEYVGLGVNNVPYQYIKSASFKDITSYKSLQNFINENTRYKKREATRITNQLISFQHEMSIGDTVIIPNFNSDLLSFGTVKSDVYLKENPPLIKVNGKDEPLPEKRRKVSWEKTINKDDNQNDLKALTSSHYGLTNADIFSEKIESILSSLFQKDNQTYLVIQIRQDEEINAFDLNRFLSSLTYFYKEFCKEADAEINEDLTIKIRLQSKGSMVLKAFIAAGLIGLGTIISLSNNSKVKIDATKGTIEGSSDGFLKSISDFLDRNQERKKELLIFQDSLEKLKAARNIDASSNKNIPNEPKK